MTILCDVNFLLSLCHEVQEHNAVAKARLDATSAAGEFVVAVHDTLFGDERFVYRHEPAGLQEKLREYTKGFPCSPKLWQDAYLAAFAATAGLGLITFDRGFGRFVGLRAEILAV